ISAVCCATAPRLLTTRSPSPYRKRDACRRLADSQAHDSSGDHAGSEAKPGGGTFCSLRPEISTVNSDGPPLPPGSRKNIRTRPLGAKVGPSLWKPKVRVLAPDPSVFMMPIENCPPPCLVKAI